MCTASAIADMPSPPHLLVPPPQSSCQKEARCSLTGARTDSSLLAHRDFVLSRMPPAPSEVIKETGKGWVVLKAVGDVLKAARFFLQGGQGT